MRATRTVEVQVEITYRFRLPNTISDEDALSAAELIANEITDDLEGIHSNEILSSEVIDVEEEG